ncbi:MAG: hypothetical protein LBQ28_02150 [Prevotellaceae bacterium]|jgi:hypothetical protein|nr:hypothetical protein [Prevotellaceae bacterium]
MKKVFYLAIAALLAMSFTFTSCSKDDEVTTPDSLTGTSWGISAGGESVTLTFSTQSLFTFAYSGSEGEEIFGGTYVYSKPKVTLSDGEDEIYGTVDGNKLTLDFFGDELVLTRK